MSDALKTVQLSVKKFRQAWQALVELSKKTLPSQEAELKIGLLVKAYEPINDGIAERRKKLDDRHFEKAGAKVALKDPHGYAQKVSAFDDVQISIRLPKELIKKADLPSVADGEGDLTNRSSTAAIRAMLGPLFDWEGAGETKQLHAAPDPDAFAGLDAIVTADVDETAEPGEAPAPAIDAPVVGTPEPGV